MSLTSQERREFVGLSVAQFASGMLNIGVGAVNIAMLVPFGPDRVAGVGLSNILIAALTALSFGFIDQMSANIAQARARNQRGEVGQLWQGAIAFLIPWGFVLWLVVLSVPIGLSYLKQPQDTVAVASSYLLVRAPFTVIVVLQLTVLASLRVCGLKKAAVLALAIGFTLNLLLNYVFLYVEPFNSDLKPEQVVGAVTVAVQFLTIAGSSAALWWHIRSEKQGWQRTIQWSRAVTDAVDYGHVTMTIGTKNLNDYAGSIFLMLFIGHLGTAALAAAQIAATLLAIFFRLPQALCNATLIIYSRIVASESAPMRRDVIRNLASYTAWPSVSVGLIVTVASPSLVGLLADGKGAIDTGLATRLVLIEMCFLPFYLLQYFMTQLLIANRRRKRILTTSLVITYLFLVPSLLLSHLQIARPEVLFAVRGVSVAVIAIVFWCEAFATERLTGGIPKSEKRLNLKTQVSA